MQRAWIAFVVVMGALVTACAPLVPAPVEPAERRVPADFPEDFYRRASARGEPVFRIDAVRSLAVMHVYRGGSLARLGHDHVVASHDVQGYALLADAPAARRADIYLPVDSLTVDEEVLRKDAGFETQPSEVDIRGTRRNMLEKVLEAERYPFVLIHVRGIEQGPVLLADVNLHGVTRTLRIPIEMDTASDELTLNGKFSIRQTDFGITPYSVLGGAIQVQDNIDLRFKIHASRLR